jgi:hypothetical protein
MDAKPPRPRIFSLHIEHLMQQRQAQLIGGMIDRPRALIFKSCEAILRKGVKNPANVTLGEPKAASNTLFVPSFVSHSDNRPACLIRILEFVERQQRERKLHRDGMVS